MAVYAVGDLVWVEGETKDGLPDRENSFLGRVEGLWGESGAVGVRPVMARTSSFTVKASQIRAVWPGVKLL